MATKIILFITVLLYSIIVSQSYMYLLALKNVQLALGPDSYTQIRKLIDAAMRVNFKYVIYAALFANLLLVVITAKQPTGILFITAAIVLIAFIADILLTLKGNLPINDIINTWTPGNIPANWAEYRTKWLNIFQYRQIVDIIGFISLIAGTVFRSKL